MSDVLEIPNKQWILFYGLWGLSDLRTWVNLDGQVWEFLEFPDDYHSHMADPTPLFPENVEKEKPVWSYAHNPVRLWCFVADTGAFEGVYLCTAEDEEDSPVLRIGTDTSDDLYPMAHYEVDTKAIHAYLHTNSISQVEAFRMSIPALVDKFKTAHPKVMAYELEKWADRMALKQTVDG